MNSTAWLNVSRCAITRARSYSESDWLRTLRELMSADMANGLARAAHRRWVVQHLLPILGA